MNDVEFYYNAKINEYYMYVTIVQYGTRRQLKVRISKEDYEFMTSKATNKYYDINKALDNANLLYMLNPNRRKIRNIEPKVLKILSLYSEAKNNDMLLLSAYYNYFYGTDSLGHLMDEEAEAPATIIRVRRKLQERGYFEADTDVQKYRNRKRGEFRDYALGVDKDD